MGVETWFRGEVRSATRGDRCAMMDIGDFHTEVAGLRGDVAGSQS